MIDVWLLKPLERCWRCRSHRQDTTKRNISFRIFHALHIHRWPVIVPGTSRYRALILANSLKPRLTKRFGPLTVVTISYCIFRHAEDWTVHAADRKFRAESILCIRLCSAHANTGILFSGTVPYWKYSYNSLELIKSLQSRSTTTVKLWCENYFHDWKSAY